MTFSIKNIFTDPNFCPLSTIISSLTATSPRNLWEPVPSITVALIIFKSYMFYFVNIAVAVLLAISLPRKLYINFEAANTFFKFIPLFTPIPFNIYNTSSVATFPLAPFA